jgi:hypothetical protein
VTKCLSAQITQRTLKRSGAGQARLHLLARRWFKLRLFPSALAIVFLLGFLILRAPPAFAQTPGWGVIYGWVYGFTWDDQLVPLVWVQVTASNPNFPLITASTGGNGVFELPVPVGTYNLTVSPLGYVARSSMVSVSDGSASTVSFYLEQSHVPIPEFPTQMVSTITVMALAVTLLARRTKRKH